MPGPCPKHAARASLFNPCSLLADVSIWATSLLGVAVRRVICVFSFFFFLLDMLPSEIPKLPTDPLVRGFPGVWKHLLLHDSLPRMGVHPQLFCLSFYLLYFVLSPFKENGLPFWVLGVLCQRSEVILWNLLSVQMIF